MAEPDELYQTWYESHNPRDLNKVVDALRPYVDYKLGAMGLADDPRMKHQARLFAAEAVKNYNPSSGVKLGTWVQSNLQSMQRFSRMNRGPVKIPDRIALDAWTIEKASREHLDETGEEPDVKQLADRSKLSVARIAKVRRATRPIGAESESFNSAEEETDYLPDAVQYVYDESDATDRKLIEMTTGYGGRPTMSKAAIAQKLGLTPSFVTRRTERIAQKLLDMERMMQEAY